jgi:multidrug resistance efflux pump
VDFKVTDVRPTAHATLPGVDQPDQPDEVILKPRHRASAADGRLRHGPMGRIRRKWSLAQVVGGLLIAAVGVTAVVWYVPRVVNNDRNMLTGAVTSSGVVTLNFESAGTISAVKVQPNQSVHKGQVLAVEYEPNADALVAADNAEISAVQTKIAQLKTNETLYPLTLADDKTQIASENAQYAADLAQLATDRMRMTATEIIAPSAGVIVATNGQPGEAVTSSGIRDYSGSSAQGVQQQRPTFSLLPEGPQSTSRVSASGSSLPVITLRVSSGWGVVTLIPEDRVSSIKAGQAVTVSVPAAGIKDVRGKVQEVLPSPVETSAGPEYQAVISITGIVASQPLAGMATDVELSH